jgi:hypothetical protein
LAIDVPAMNFTFRGHELRILLILFAGKLAASSLMLKPINAGGFSPSVMNGRTSLAPE